MQIKIDARVLESIVSTVAQAISSKPTKPEYECVYMNVNANSGKPFLAVQAQDNGIAIRKVTDELDVMDDGIALIPAKTLLSFLKLMKGEVTLTMDSNGTKCTLKNGGKKSTISCMDADDYNPDFADLPDADTVSMSASDYIGVVESTMHCISVDQGRLILTGVNFAFNAETGACVGVGLDGFRLARVRRAAETNSTFNVTIPANMANLIAKVIHGEEVSFRFGNGLVIVEDYDTAIQASLLAGEYMDVDRIIPQSSMMQAKVNVADMLEAVRMAMISAHDGEKNLIVMNFDKEDTLEISAMSDFSSAVSAIPCDLLGEMSIPEGNSGKVLEGGTKEIAFNGKYVEDALKAASEFGGEVTLKFNTPVSPMGIVPLNRDDFYQLVLPVRRL